MIVVKLCGNYSDGSDDVENFTCRTVNGDAGVTYNNDRDGGHDDKVKQMQQ